MGSWLGTRRSAVREFKIQRRDGNENVWKTISLIGKTTTLHAHHTFVYISLQFLLDYDVKMPKFAFYGKSNKQRRNFLSLPELGYDALEFNFRRVRLHLTKEVRCDLIVPIGVFFFHVPSNSARRLCESWLGLVSFRCLKWQIAAIRAKAFFSRNVSGECSRSWTGVFTSSVSAHHSTKSRCERCTC